MRHRASRHLPAFLRLHRVRPRRRLAPLATRWHPSGWLPARPSTRLASAMTAVLLLLSGGVLAVGALDDDTVPAVDNAPPDRSFLPSTSRSSDRPTLASSPGVEGRPHKATPPAEEPASDTASPAPRTPTPDPSESPDRSLLPLPASAPHTDVTPPAPTAATPDLPTQTDGQAGGHGSGGPAVTVDRTAPSTVLDSMPAQRADSATADFSFHASEGASFTCSLDGGAFRPCGSGVGYTVQPGWHDFAVRATDRAGNVDASPARWHWHTSARHRLR